MPVSSSPSTKAYTSNLQIEEKSEASTLPRKRLLRAFNIAAFIIFAGELIYFLFFQKSQTKNFYRSVQLCLVLVISSSSHFVVSFIPPASKLYYSQQLIEFNGFRWFEYAMTASAMMYIIACLCGISRVELLVMLPANMCAVIGIGSFIEKQQFSNTVANNSLTWMFIAWAIFGSMWVQLLSASNGLSVGYLLLPFMIFLYLMFGFVQLLHYLRLGPWQNYTIVEVSYILLSVSAKSLMVYMVSLSNSYHEAAKLI